MPGRYAGYFADRSQQLMVNCRVHDLDVLLRQLRISSVEVLDRREDDKNDRFAWLVDCDGRRFESGNLAEDQ